jgi:hypothetical protein
MENTQSATYYARQANEIESQIPLKKEIAKARSKPGIPLSSPDIGMPDEEEEAEPERKQVGWLRYIIYTVPFICLGLLGIYWYSENQARELHQERERAFVPILGDIQAQCSSEAISRALEEWSNGPKESYRTGHILIYDVRKSSIGIEYHFLPDNLRAEGPRDLETVLCFWENQIAVGEYRNAEGVLLGLAYQVVWNVVGFEWTSGKVIAAIALAGGEPPLQGLGQGDHIGSAPYSEFKEWIKALPEK